MLLNICLPLPTTDRTNQQPTDQPTAARLPVTTINQHNNSTPPPVLLPTMTINSSTPPPVPMPPSLPLFLDKAAAVRRLVSACRC